MKNRGPTDQFGPWRGFITIHPASLLRRPDDASRALAYRTFTDDLKRARAMAER